MEGDIAVRIPKDSYKIAKEIAKKEQRNIRIIVKLALEYYGSKLQH